MTDIKLNNNEDYLSDIELDESQLATMKILNLKDKLVRFTKELNKLEEVNEVLIKHNEELKEKIEILKELVKQ